MNDIVLQLNKVCFERSGTSILSAIDWSIRTGEHWALLGANGSGKTTLLRIICGYAWPGSGQVTVLGRHFGRYDLRALRRQIGWVSSHLEHQIPDRQRVVEVVLSGLEATIGTYREYDATEVARAREFLRALNCGQLAEQRFATLSQGERQKVLIARAWMTQPTLLILDEPCAGLDPAARERFVQKLDELAHRPDAPTLVLVTHHVEEIVPAFSKALILKDGKVFRQGPCEQVLCSSVLSEAFHADVTVLSHGDRYRLDVRYD